MSVDNSLLLVLGSSGIGDAEPDLGEKLMRAFLSQLLESDSVPAKIICMSSAIFLTTEGSAMLDVMEQLEARGSTILSCGTCLEYYGRKESLRVGHPTNMHDTVDAMRTFARVLRL